jgi:multiple sugar transport system permease protein
MPGVALKERQTAQPGARWPARAGLWGSAAAREEARLGRWLVLPVAAVTGALVVYPLVLGFEVSLYAAGNTLSTRGNFVGAGNYADVIKDPATISAAIHTLEYVAICLVLELAGGLVAAVALRRAFRGRGFMFGVLIVPWALPSVVSGVLWRRIFAPDNGLLNSLLLHLHLIHSAQVWMATGWAIPWIAVVHVWGTLPLITLILLAGLQSIPDEVYSASAVDGATPARQFWHITLPLLRPALTVAAIIGLVDAITIFDEIYVLNGIALNTSSVVMQVYNLIFVQADFPHGIAFAFLIAAFSALLAVVALLAARLRRTA